VKSSDTSDEDNYKTVTLLVNPNNPEKSETLKKQVRIIGGNKNAEDSVKWQIEFDNIPLRTAVAKTKMALVAQLKG
jgi:hypothetical protein